MEFNFNKIKNLMQEDNNQPLPPELDWSNMKDGIFEKMASIEQKKPSHRKNRYPWKRIGLFLLLFFALTFGLYSISQRKTNVQNTNASTIVQLPNSDLQKNESNTLDEVAPTNQTENSGEYLMEKKPETKAKNVPLNSKETDKREDQTRSLMALIGIDKLPKDQHLSDFEPKHKELISNESLSKSITTPMDIDKLPKNQQLNELEPLPNDFKTNDSGLIQSTPNTVKNIIPSFAEAESRNLTLQTKDIQMLPMFGFNRVKSEKAYLSMLDFPVIDHLNRPSSANDKSPNQLIIEGGVTFWNDGDRNSISDRARYETPLISFQLQGYFVKNLKRNYFIMAGLQYQQLESKFSYNSTIPDYIVIIKDTIVQVQNNPLTGEQNIIYGDVEQTVQAERRVRHYNKTQLFKVSLAGGKSWRFHPFQFDVYLGGALNSLVQNKGRMLFDNSIINYNGASNALFQNQMTVDGVFGARVHYFLNQNLAFTTGFQTQKSLMNWSNLDNINLYPASLGLQLGLSYSLK